MADPLATFAINVPKYSRAHLVANPYDEYPSRLKELLPENHFNHRIQDLRSFILRRYPSPYWDVCFTFIVTIAIISFSSVFFASFIGRIPVWYSVCVIGSLIAISTTYGFRARKGAELISRFDADLVTMLREFTAVDLPKHSVRWSISKRPSSHHSNQTTLSSPPLFTITIAEYDPNGESEDLPAYVNERDYVQPEIVISNPPCYNMVADQRTRMERFIAGEDDGAEEEVVVAGEREGERAEGRAREREGENVVGNRLQIDDVILLPVRQQRRTWEGPIVIDYSAGGEVTLIEMGEVMLREEETDMVLPQVAMIISEEGLEIAPGEDPPNYEGVVLQPPKVTSDATVEADGVPPPGSTHENGSSSTPPSL